MFFLKLLFLVISISYSKDKHLLYQKVDKGSESQFNPISYYFNGAFDTIQNPTYFSQVDYFKKHKVVWDRVSNPFWGIRKGGGLKVLLLDEFVPFAKRAIPNYTLHLIGGGYDYRRLSEWFDENDYSHPYIWAFFLQYAAAFGNEAIESTNTTDIGPHDHIADLYFFDVIGKILFLDERVVTFFRDDVQLKAWPFQPTFDFHQQHMMNSATNYILRPNLFNSDWRPFLFTGLQIMGGVSYLKNTKGLSMAAGMAPTDPLRGKSRFVTGLFWDEEGSLMSSLFINGSEDQRFRFNFYPGVIKFNSISPGVFVGLQRNNDIQLGIQALIPVGAGLSF